MKKLNVRLIQNSVNVLNLVNLSLAITCVNNHCEQIMFESKICLDRYYLLLKKPKKDNIVNEKINNQTENETEIQKNIENETEIKKNVENENISSFSIISKYFKGGSCVFRMPDKFAYCGESDLSVCANCQRHGCSVFQCVNSETNVFIIFKINIRMKLVNSACPF